MDIKYFLSLSYKVIRKIYLYLKSIIYGPMILNKLFDKYLKSNDFEERKFALFLLKHKKEARKLYITDKPYIFIFGNDFVFDYYNKNYSVSYYEDFPYVEYHGKKIYMPKEMSQKQIISYIRGIEIEQDIRSPHCYFPDSVDLTGKVLVDVGGAEGIFSIDYIESIKFLYIFEADEKWIKPLELTYKKWFNKIKIIKKLVGDGKNNTISLDSYFKDSVSIDLIKIDVEGYESDVIRGAEHIISSSRNLKLLVCLYHNDFQEREVLNLLSSYDCNYRPGKMWFLSEMNIKEPSLRHGVAEFSANV